MRRDTSQRTEPKATYRVKNWAQYNAGLIARGDITVWIDKSLLTPAPAANVSRRGRPIIYPDAVIQGLLSLKQVFDLPLRALQGFAQSLRQLAFPDLPVPNYTTLSRRAQSLQVVLPALRPSEPLHLAVDSTGLKLYGEGEWKVRTHGWSKRRTWRKVHLAMDTKTGQICAALMTHQEMGDSEAMADLLEQIPCETPIDIVGGDGSYDTKACHAQIATRNATPSIPPREGAMPWPQATPGATWRNAAIDKIAESGRREWKKASGYHKRSLVENLMYRLKTLTSHFLWARTIGSQATEVAIRAGVLNRMASLARPQSARLT
ncbi:IS5 family transposase [Verminephrobacter aporrectodeae subsp. tuberculatae]|uniref:IS5 family transposase n=1 Tax=Verminephrobacter aporrectodeae subsp. tuberculatae TaxID=1110392 RepID=A0ABT3KPU0_9BURK|nr:IS5 family transposase [Verminephrobacter aporrectodeae]MCW5320346.1 IS5 family transposase [Verminephrobacter aporrectodeae subsp. tuberculatae]